MEISSSPPNLKAECAWRTCRRTCVRTDEIGVFLELPPRWRCIVLSRWLLLDVEAVVNAERDGILCPEHARLLHDRLLKPLS